MSEIKVNKISPRAACGTTTLGDSGDTFTIPAGVTITNSGTAAGFGSTGEISWDTTKKTGDFTGVSGVGYFVDTTSGAVTVTLPSSPSAGNVVGVSDYNGTAGTSNITVARNGSNINGDASNFTISKDFSAVQLIYIDATVGWQTVFTGNTSDVQNPFLTATGGTITTCGDFKIHTFTGPGTFTVSTLGTTAPNNAVDYLVVAGGGGGAVDIGGGGGGGGTRFRAGTFSVPSPLTPIGAPAGITVTATSFPITVGAGGTASAAPPAPVGGSGGVSTFSTITSAGGGGGGKLLTTGVNGGNGGGAGGPNSAAGPIAGGSGNTPPVSPAQGKNGGTALGGTPYSPGPIYDGAGAGGGGVQSVGANSGPTYSPSPAFVADGAGAGGAGMPFPGNSFQSVVTGYGGGGGGGGYCGPGSNIRPGGTATDGGGAGGSSGGQAGTAGTANRGGGGGGGAGAGGVGAAGGSGIVVIRYKFQ